MRQLYFTILIICTAVLAAAGQDDETYHLFNPVPKDELREFNPDRPSVTESSVTVDAGHFQFEADGIRWTRHSQDARTPRTINIINGYYKLGLLKNTDIQFGIDAYDIQQDPEKHVLDKGFGSTSIRLKQNLWGNDGTKKTALAIVPYAIFVSGNPFDSDVSYGVSMPFSYSISDKLDLGTQSRFDFLLGEKNKYELNYMHSVILEGDLVGDLEFFIEGVVIIPKTTAAYSANGGLVYNVGDNLRIDIAINLGLNKPAATQLYAGAAFRL